MTTPENTRLLDGRVSLETRGKIGENRGKRREVKPLIPLPWSNVKNLRESKTMMYVFANCL